MRVVILLLVVSGYAVGSLRAEDAVRIRPDIVYGHKDGMALTFDVITPANANGAGVLWMMSGGWYSPYVEPAKFAGACKFLLDRGFTVIPVRHGSAPKYTVPEAVGDVKRAVRFIRLNAKDLGVDADRLGVTGGSAGGHLTLMLATTGDDGNPMASDPVLKPRSRIAAAVALYPPTDLRGWVTDPPPAIKSVAGLKPPLTFDAKLEPSVSPVLHATPDDAPTLLIHGDKDPLVPIEHSKNMIAAMQKGMMKGDLLVIEGAGHSFSGQQNQEQVAPAMVKWFETHLSKK